MNKQNDFDDPDNGFGFLGSVGPKAAFFIVLIALSFMIGLVWKLYTGGNSDNAEVPIIRADADGYKMEPDDRGGMEIKFQDSTLFNSDDPDSDVENLLADNNEETPMPRSQLFAGLSTDEDMPDQMSNQMLSVKIEDGISEDEERIIGQAKEAEKIVESLVENGADAIVVQNAQGESDVVVVAANDEDTNQTDMTVEKTQEGATKVETPKVIVETKPEPAPQPAPVVKAEPKPEPKAQTIVAGDFYVQLASVKSNAAANSEWDKFVSKYSPLLNGVDHRIQTADLGAKGTFYRIQAGSMSKSNADKICDGIKSKGGSCLVKKK